ncbi:MAG: YggS family pyridoxal phosphate-dependent enzyme [Elusimicrobia bacterium]|nr:YggS family pyridoxal phosphate-dependent enzyme [Elusimicrobiota bacterium]
MLHIDSDKKQRILDNLATVLKKIKSACEKTNRNPSSVELLAVVKNRMPEEIRILAQEGNVRLFGESRVRDAAEKWEEPPLAGLRDKIKLHLVGHLQSNKAKTAARIFDSVDSIDSFKTAVELDRHAGNAGVKIPILIEINLSNPETRFGIDIGDSRDFLSETGELGNVHPCGYMAMAPMTGNPETLRPTFAAVKKIFDRDFPEPYGKSGFKNYLSLGMSGDFETAVEEGSNLPRIGSLLFQ